MELVVVGHIPAYAAGTLYRTGPGKSQVQTDDGQLYRLSHWFDGFTQTHRFQIICDPSGSRVLYNSRFSTDALIEYVRKAGSKAVFGFGQKRDPCKTLYSKIQAEFVPPEGPSAVNIGVTLSVNMPGLDTPPRSMSNERWGASQGIRTLYAKTDYNAFKKLDPETLEPIGLASQADLHPDLTGRLSASHARSDPLTGDVFNYNLSLGPTCTYRVFRASVSTGETSILATFPGIPAYIHSLLITEDYVLLCVWNSHVDVQAVQTKSFKDSIMPVNPSEPATWYVIDRRHGQGLIATYEGPAFFSYHTINAWQEQSPEDPTRIDIFADLVQANKADTLDSVLYENMKSSSPSAKKYAENLTEDEKSTITRFRLPDLPSAPTSEILKATIEWSGCREFSPELPTMNPRYVTQRSRYVYAITLRGQSAPSDGLVKFDSDTHEAQLWAHHGHNPSEPIFVPNPDGVNEDDGVLLSVVLDCFQGHSYLLCLDARDLTELGRANVKGAVGFGFHGQHVPYVGMPTGDY